MTKTILLLIFSIVLSLAGIAQNLQVHYDGAKGSNSETKRGYITTTFEMFKPDSLGSTFCFMDIDFNGPRNEPSLAYFEISRNLAFKPIPFEFHIEYNGGLLFNNRGSNFGLNFPHAAVVGLSKSIFIGESVISSYIGYRYDDSSVKHNDVQWTITYTIPIAKNKITVTGFIDFWTQDKPTVNSNNSEKQIVFLMEPQIWYNILPKFAIGGEIEVSKNFLAVSNNFEFFPTIALKYTF